MWILWLVITSGLILLMIYLSKNVRKNKLSAIEILNLRFSRGEIDEQEYKNKKELLEKD